MSAQEPPTVTAKQLLRTPREFNDKKLFVTGYFVYDAIKGGSLFANDWAAEHTGASVSVDQSVFVNPGTPTQSGSADTRRFRRVRAEKLLRQAYREVLLSGPCLRTQAHRLLPKNEAISENRMQALRNVSVQIAGSRDCGGLQRFGVVLLFGFTLNDCV